jgi:hypothetical protein
VKLPESTEDRFLLAFWVWNLVWIVGGLFL